MRIFYYLISFLLLLSCSKTDEEKKKATTTSKLCIIKGVSEDVKNTKVFLTDTEGKIITEAIIDKGIFNFEVDPKQKIAFLHLENGIKEPVFLDTVTYTVRSWDNNSNRLLVAGRHIKQIEYNEYQKDIANIDRQLLDSYMKGDLENTIVILKEKRMKTIVAYIRNNNNFVGLYELQRHKDILSKKQLKSLFALLDNKLRNIKTEVKLSMDIASKEKDYSSKTIKKTVSNRPKQKAKPERFPAPLFSGLSPEGYLVDLSSIASSNKITMLDFWATWCEPCRMQNPFWVRLYKRFRNKGFEIISVAEETEKSKPFLEAAIAEDGMIWKHIVDQNHEIAELYGAYSLPHAVLIDNEGKIIYHKASARDVEEYLIENLGE